MVLVLLMMTLNVLESHATVLINLIVTYPGGGTDNVPLTSVSEIYTNTTSDESADDSPDLLSSSNSNSILSDSTKDIYVSVDGSDSNTGEENSPYQTISKAFSSVTASDNAVIHLGEGTFNPPTSYLNINFNHVNQNTSLTFVGAGFNKTIIESTSTNYFAQVGSNAVVAFENITFTNFKPSSQASVIYSQGTLTVDSCIFESNGNTNSYGAIYFYANNRNLTVKNSIFKFNIARQSTADIYAANGNITLFNNKFINPKITSPNIRSTRGYSVFASTSYTINITGNTFENIASPNLYDAGLKKILS